jgi:hypothetical protein
VFMGPLFGPVTGIEGQTHLANNFTADCLTLLIDCPGGPPESLPNCL